MDGACAKLRGMAQSLTREAVVAATRELIRKDGLAAVSLRRVGASLGVTAPALYAYVRDKRDLLRAIADEEFSALISRFGDVTGDDPVERTRGYGRAYIDHALANPELFKVMFLFQPRIGVGTQPDDDDLPSANEAFSLPAESMVAAMEAGRIRETDPLIATLTMWIAMHGCAEVLLMGFDLDEGFRERLIDSMIDTVIRGMSA
jgi:AcrR family transcriptional regulator